MSVCLKCDPQSNLTSVTSSVCDFVAAACPSNVILGNSYPATCSCMLAPSVVPSGAHVRAWVDTHLDPSNMILRPACRYILT